VPTSELLNEFVPSGFVHNVTPFALYTLFSVSVLLYVTIILPKLRGSPTVLVTVLVSAHLIEVTALGVTVIVACLSTVLIILPSVYE